LRELRVYDKSNLNPEGIKEDPTRCIASVSAGMGWHFIQCSRKRGFGPDGLLCRQHAKILEEHNKVNRMFQLKEMKPEDL